MKDKKNEKKKKRLTKKDLKSLRGGGCDPVENKGEEIEREDGKAHHEYEPSLM